MHEFSIVQNIFPLIEKVAAENNLSVIKKVTLKIGLLRQIVPETLRFAFQVLSENTIAEKAELLIIEEPVKVYCAACKQEFIVQDNIYLCAHCGAANLKVLSGKEIMLDNIEGEKK